MHIFGHPLKLVIFDVDGVLLDLNAVFSKNLAIAAKNTGLPIEPIETYLRSMAIGNTRGNPGFRGTVKNIWPEAPERIVNEFHDQFTLAEHKNFLPPYTFTIPTLKWFSKRDVLMGLCTNNSDQALQRKLSKAKVSSDYFIYAATSSLGYAKPDARMLNAVIGVANVRTEHVIFVGDWYADLDAARASRVEFVATLSGGLHKDVFLREGVVQSHIIHTVAQLPTMIEQE